MTSPLFEIDALEVAVEDKQIVNGLSLTLRPGEVHAIMGPNGSGKSTLANSLMGHPRYTINGGDIRLAGQSVIEMAPDERARAGLFLAFQYPTDIPGVSMINFLRRSMSARRGEEIPVREFRQVLNDVLGRLQMDEQFVRRYVNDGFSGGEKKRAEILQLGLLQPRVAVMDETDSGLDIDALRIVSEGINTFHSDQNAILSDHPLPAHPALRPARSCPCPDRWPNRRVRRRQSWPSGSSGTATNRSWNETKEGALSS